MSRQESQWSVGNGAEGESSEEYLQKLEREMIHWEQERYELIQDLKFVFAQGLRRPSEIVEVEIERD